MNKQTFIRLDTSYFLRCVVYWKKLDEERLKNWYPAEGCKKKVNWPFEKPLFCSCYFTNPFCIISDVENWNKLNRPIFCGVRNRGIAPARHWKNFSWKIIHIYVVVVFREKKNFFFLKKKKKFFFQVILYSKNGDSESVLLKESFYTGMTSGQISYIVEVTRPEKLIRTYPGMFYRGDETCNFLFWK